MKFFTQQKFKFLVLGLFFPLFIFGLFLSLPVLAQTATDTLGVDVVADNVALGGGDFRVIVVKIINTILTLLGIVVVVIILYGGFVYMTAGGEDDKVSKARKIIINGIIGLAIILSAWAITRFVLNKLGQATGLQNVVDTSLEGDCFTPGTPYYEKYSNTVHCQDVVDDFPDQSCTEKHFIAKSITPSTKLDDVVGMNNVIIRAVFSREVGSSLNEAIKIEKDGVDITGEFNFSFKENNQVIEANSITNDGCDSSQNGKCISKGDYVVRLLDIKDKNGNSLEVDVENCDTYPKDASFKVGNETNILDNNSPVITNLKFNNLSGGNVRVAPNKYYPISVSVNDRSFVGYGGNAYVLIKVYKKGSEQNVLKKYLHAPMVSFGSSAEFSFNYALLVKNNFEKNVDYIIDVTSYDIDSNFSNEKLEFRVVPESCFNDVQDADEEGIDVGGICGTDLGSSCKKQNDCSLSYKCLNAVDNLCVGTDDCLCKKWPYIENIEQNNGASGNWITISGRNFGNSNGEIHFNYDTNNDNVFDFANIVSLAQCRGKDVWNDNWIIVEVPNKPTGVTVNPVISVKNLELAGSVSDSISTPNYPSSMNPGHVLNLHLDEISGTTITNSINANNNLQVIGNVAFGNDGKFGKAIAFDKDPDSPSFNINDKEILKLYVNAGDPLDLAKGSIFAWIKKTNNTVGQDTIVSKNSSYGLFLVDNKLAVGEWYPSGGGRVIPSNTNVVDGKWHQVGLVFDKGVTNGTKLYVDGNLVLTTTTQFFAGYAGDFVVGANNNGTANFYTGFIDELNVWNRVLSSDEITSLYNTVSPNYKFTDFGNDDFGPNVGVFTYNNIKRPGLCAVTVSGSEQTMAEPKKDIEATGKAFGTTGKMFFGINDVAIKSWSDNSVQAVVPFVSKGKYGVFVQVNGEKSNAVPFSVVETGADKLPLILKIDPVTTTPGSYITIIGNDFGSAYGNVLINGVESGELPIYCGNTWSDKQIIVKVPLNIDIGKASVVVETSNKKSTVGDNFVNIVSGSAQPSLCKIEPAKGSAPLEENKKLILKGENFSITPNFYFWKADKLNIQENNKETWLQSSAHNNVVPGKEVKISIPVDSEDGKSMTSGPIVVGAAGKFSNSINYEVIDCRLLGNDIPSGFQCCTVGSETGILKTKSEVCADSVRESGYSWRFTTGKIPEKFYVLEQCTKGVVPPVPSPTPWSARNEGKNVCVNAAIQVAFSLPVKDDTQNRNNFHIYECGTSSEISLSNCNDVTATKFEIFINSGLVNFKLKADQNLSANTWYNIALSENLISQKVVTELSSNNVTKNEKLQKTKECRIGNNNFAYCFDFKTGNSENLCTLVRAGIYPSLYESRFLGVLQDVRWPLSSNLTDIFTIGNPNLHPQFFDIYGIGNQECIAMDVDGLGWVWSPDDATSPPVTSKKYTANSRYVDSRGVAIAWSGTPVDGSEIFATLTSSTKSIVATSTIKVELSNPSVVSTWPVCLEACINAEIGAQFNQLMIKDSYDGNVHLYKCTDENCDNNKVEQSINISSNSDYQNLRFYNSTDLATSTWYLVELTDGIYSVGDARQITQAGGISLKPGKPLPRTTWKFKTKDSSEPCIVDNVSVIPNPFFAYYVGQKTQYSAQARGAVDNCSPKGQLLNPWNYGWEWSVRDINIADTTNFSISNNFNINFCSLNCLPAGSDVSIRADQTYPVCGDSIVDSGEDCDIGMSGEIVGVSCTYNCLRPGNTNTTTCGNGIVDENLGEECDPNAENASEREGGYCSNNCLRIGSKQEVSNVSSAPICGSGNITYGEDCDIKDPNSSQGCSNNCLNSGTKLAQVWCDSRGASMSSSDEIACQNAISICGNGDIESGEECEAGNNGASENNCNSRCLLTNVCGHILEQCEKGDEGCNDDCTLKGSALSYNTPSLCGDGVLGTGESNRCEVVLEANENLISSPVQIITAKGDAPASANDLEIVSAMNTKIFAKPVKYYFRDQNNIEKSINITTIKGEADYSLMCGYEEYSEENDDSKYNDCPNNVENNLGVASNSCCYNRPVRTAQYPAVNAEGVCRNTYIEVQFPKLMNKLSFENNVSIVQGYDKGENYANYECSQHQQIDVTTEVNQYLGVSDTDNIAKGFWQKVWLTIKDFFVKLFTGKAFASEVVRENNDLSGRNIVWCASSNLKVAPNVTYENNNSVTTTIAGLLLSNLLDSNVYVLVVLNGDKDGIKDFNNVGIKNVYSNIREDFWLFKTGNDLCKVDKIEVDPVTAVFDKQNDSKDFKINVFSKNTSQKITRIPNVYDWQYSWHPTNNPIFNIPNIDSSTNIISSKNVEGQMDGLAQVKITKDISAENSDEGRTFSANFYLQSFFCSNIWPSNLTSVSGSSASQVSYSDNLFSDNKFNFSFLYCADNNNPLLTEDDLPLFDNIILSNNNLDEYGVGDTALGRYLLFSSTTNDALGIQIFENVPSSNGTPRSLTQWYMDKFDSLGDMKPSTVAGYEALSNGSNYYVSVYDVDKDRNGNLGTVYNYVILFSLTNNSSQDSSKVFSQIIENVKFNTKMTDFGKCLLAGNLEEEVRTGTGEISEIDCTTDFDCRDTSGLPLTGTAGFCHNEISKFFRDLNRLSSLSVSQANLDKYFSADLGKSDFVGDLKSGSFVYGYSNSKWQNSWGLLNSYAGKLALDPVNQWAGCTDHDPLTCWNAASSTYACPNFAQIYEYRFVTSTQSYNLYAPFEYLQSGQDADFVKRYIDTNKINFGRFCEVGNLTSLMSVCGDNLISTSAGEECEPPNSTKLLSSYRGNSCTVPGTRYLATCNPNNCTWNVSSSCTEKIAVCGNRTVETDEECDEGVLNGTYGHCGSNCKLPLSTNYTGAGSCGDKIWQSSQELCDINENRYLTGYCELNKNKVCSNDNDCKENFSGRVETPIYETKQSLCSSRDRNTGLPICSGGVTKQVSCGGPEDDICRTYDSNSTCIEQDGNKVCSGRAVQSISCVVDNDCIDSDGNKLTYQEQVGVNVVDESYTNNFGSCLSENETTYDFKKDNTCSYDCRSRAGYCGDGIRQSQYEQCDDSNNNNGDACDSNCNFEKFCTYPYVQNTLSCNEDNNCPMSKIDIAGNQKFILSNSNRKVCLFNEKDLVYTPINNSDVVEPFYCESDEYCRDQDTYLSRVTYINNIATADLVFNSLTCRSIDIIGGFGDNDNAQCLPKSAEYVVPEQSQENNVVSPSCGNGVRDFIDKNNNSIRDDGENWTEQCDVGNQNGVECNPTYGQSCTYCNSACVVQTKESAMRCGNGIVDKDENGNWLEACDYKLTAEGNQVFSHNDLESNVLRCTSEQKGSYSCNNSCQLVENNCINCGLGINLPLARLAIINPMVAGGNANYTTQPYVALLKQNVNLTNSFVASVWRKINFAGNARINSAEPNSLIVDGVGIPVVNGMGLETNSQCTYKLFFNPFTNDFMGGSTTVDAKVVAGLGDLFDYPVNSEVSYVDNEVIMSPAVPEDSIRVVIRWKKNGNINFVGNFYSDKIESENVQSTSFRYVENDDKTYDAMTIVGSTTTPNEYVVPEYSNNHSVYTDSVARFYFHPLINTEYSGTQAMTFSAKNLNSTVSSTLGFYVSSPNGPINQLKNNDVWVEVYRYHPNQVPSFSIYKPDLTFKLSNAKSSAYSLASYWHVFNIYMNENRIALLPVGKDNVFVPMNSENYWSYNPFVVDYGGAIINGECEVRKAMPNTTPCNQ